MGSVRSRNGVRRSVMGSPSAIGLSVSGDDFAICFASRLRALCWLILSGLFLPPLGFESTA
jgi:hypothetical protein